MATFKDPFKVDGVTLPTPDEYKPGIEDLSSEETGRTLDGIMHKDVVAVKDYYEFVWKDVSWEKAARIFKAVDGKTKVSLTYADPRVPNRFLTNNFYVGKRSCSARNLNDPVHTWKDVTLQFTRI
ncbi:MAG: hypothetical protein IJI25_08650 [Eubacterium sp.]|nr:hypothetical protein [Eubacterium sp.]